MTYQQALAAPTRPGADGWKYAGEESVQAAAARIFGERMKMDGELIYNWANKYGVILCSVKFVQKHMRNKFAILIAALRDIPLEQAEKELAERGEDTEGEL